MPRILPKSITIDECDDLFEKEDETEERATSTSNGIDKSKLTIGVQVMARDSSANESKNHNSAKREAFDAVIVEPGISDNGTMIWISWGLQKEKKRIPLENIDEIVPPDTRFMRKRKKPKLLLNLPRAAPKPRCDSSDSHFTPRKKQKSNSNSIPSIKFIEYNGEPVNITLIENKSKLYYLKAKFGSNLEIIEGELNGELLQLEKTIIRNGIEFHLVFSKLKEKKQNTHMSHKMEKDRYVAYYLGGHGFDTVADVKRKLEELGDFSDIALNCGKICARLELMVSPASSQYPGIFKMKADEFELIEENQHVGCGFASPEFFEGILRKGPRNRTFKDVFAMQIRMFCPRLGWFKGMLMKKPSITKVQLPESMKKVQQSRSPNCSDDAHLLVIQTFPTLGSRIIRDKLDNKPSPKSVLAKNKPLNDSYKKLLESNGIYQNDCEEYENYFKDYDQGRRNDGSIVGVADPTSSLPCDSVFVAGFTPEYCREYCRDQVFITRYPCTEKADGKLLKVVTSRPNGMSSEDWKYLRTIPYGILVFGSSSTPTSLPEQIGNGDLDGDYYHVIWDFTIVKKIEEFSSNSIDNTASAYSSSSERSENHHNNNTTHDLMLKYPDDEYDYSGVQDLMDDQEQDIEEAQDLIDHRKNKILVRWKGGCESWELLSRKRKEMPYEVAEYGRQNNLEEHTGWKWIKEFFRGTDMKRIRKHRVDNDVMTFIVRYEDGSDEERTLAQMKIDAPDILNNYARENNLLQQWRTEYVGLTKVNWFENVRNHSAELKHLYYPSQLTKSIYSQWRMKVKKELGYTEATDALSNAFKKTLDFRKHATSISLPSDLIERLPRKLRHCVMPA